MAHRSKMMILEHLENKRGGVLVVFAIKQGWAALFGGLMLLGILIVHFGHLPLLTSYDWLFLWAVAIQVFMLAAKLERPHEVITILVFHLLGLGMELFKTSGAVGSWTYPYLDHTFFKAATVPLFSGFMYAAVGSYIARAWRVLDLTFIRYPRRWLTVVLAAAIYINFFLDSLGIDFRIVLFLAVVVLFGRTMVTFRLNRRVRRMPLVIGFVLIALFIWAGENISTYAGVWLYPSQIHGWHPVGLEKVGSWILLMIISFVSIDVLDRIRRHTVSLSDSKSPTGTYRDRACRRRNH